MNDINDDYKYKNSSELLTEYSIDNYLKKSHVDLCHELIRIYDNDTITIQNILRFIQLANDLLDKIDNRKIREKIKKLRFFYIEKNKDKILKLKELKKLNKSISISKNNNKE